MIRMMTEADEPMLAQLFLKGRRQAFHWVDPQGEIVNVLKQC